MSDKLKSYRLLDGSLILAVEKERYEDEEYMMEYVVMYKPIEVIPYIHEDQTITTYFKFWMPTSEDGEATVGTINIMAETNKIQERFRKVYFEHVGEEELQDTTSPSSEETDKKPTGPKVVSLVKNKEDSDS